MNADALVAEVGRLYAEHTRRDELEESKRIRERALAAAARAPKVVQQIERMNRIYRERLEGVREPVQREERP